MKGNRHKDINVQIIAVTYLKNMYGRIVTDNNSEEDILATLDTRIRSVLEASTIMMVLKCCIGSLFKI